MGKTSSKQAIAAILQNDNLARLVARAKLLQKISVPFKKVIDKQLALHCYIDNYHNGCLFLIVDNNAWATRVRYTIPNLLQQLKKTPEFTILREINCQVRLKNPEEPSPKNMPLILRKQNSKLKLSVHNAKLIKTVAQGITDKKLKAALERLAKHGLKTE